MPAAPLPAISLFTSAVCETNPSFDTVTEKGSFRCNENVHGVAGHVKPWDVLTDAPGGVVSTTNCCVVPRVIVAHADDPHAIAMIAAYFMTFKATPL